MKDIPREKVVLSTKVGRYGQEEFDFSAERVTASVTESLKRLNVDYIDIIQCHDIEFGDLDQAGHPLTRACRLFQTSRVNRVLLLAPSARW